MSTFKTWLDSANAIAWGEPMLVLILGTGLFLTIGLRGMPLSKVGLAFRLMMRGRRGAGAGDVSPFNALMTSLSATIGTGNIAGVATAIALGGPGALFWMWCTALVGMATKYGEAVCAVHFRVRDEQGAYSGGPMYYIRGGLKPHWHWLGFAFALFGALAGFGIGNMVQANSVVHALDSVFALPSWLSAAVMTVLVALVILGGVKRIGTVSGALVPLMSLGYLLAGLIIVLLNITEVPAALALIVKSAFTSTAAEGGFAGATVWLAIRYGVARGVFSNEAGLGSAAIAHAAAQTDNPVRQGVIAMLGSFIDTIIVCSVTGLAIVLTGVWTSGASGPALSVQAFDAALPGGNLIVAVSLALFAFTTILGWSYYSERCVVYLLGTRALLPFRLLWVAAVPIGAQMELTVVWSLADLLNALMAIPNLIALLLLSPLIFRLTRERWRDI